ncbi:Hypothetical predicted protein [Olea europaea subsp. europaea]|uniref:Uncharacterized protein n=1 Tax=Olea europaea subsp. europaea TaxID=158383 RepID=A0A8S0UYG6_OLEEU|nr:Hypothetical predicted protein [Olea europaea subsp. europaea]
MPAEATDLSEAPDEKAPKKVVWNFELIDIPRPQRPNSYPSSALEISIPLCNVRAIIPSEIPAYKTEFAEFGGLIDFGSLPFRFETLDPSDMLGNKSVVECEKFARGNGYLQQFVIEW